MKITGLANLSAEDLALLGTCEIPGCGKTAQCFVRDMFVEVPYDNGMDRLSPGKLHRYCPEHEQPGETIMIREGPLMYQARMGGE